MIDGKLDDTEIKLSHDIVERCKNYVLKEHAKSNNDEINHLKKQMITLTETIKSQNFNSNVIRK